MSGLIIEPAMPKHRGADGGRCNGNAKAREVQLLFDSLETKLKGGVPAAEVDSNVYSLLEELREDVAGELKVGAP